jgi:5-methylcytosine-specific restriction endonuclease McrA
LKKLKKKGRPGGKIKSNAASGFLYLFNATRCTYCFRALDNDEVTVDHIIPQSKGGSGWAFNQAICCEECNVKKSDRLLSVVELRRFFGEARTLALLDEMKRCKIERN